MIKPHMSPEALGPSHMRDGFVQQKIESRQAVAVRPLDSGERLSLGPVASSLVLSAALHPCQLTNHPRELFLATTLQEK